MSAALVSTRYLLLSRDLSKLPGTWVQCSNPSCKKWRYLQNTKDPQSVADNFTCKTNPNPTYNNCNEPEEDRTNEEPLIDSQYGESSIVWARVTGHPWSPAMLEIDPDTGRWAWLANQQNSNQPSQYHVVFFENNVSRAWISHRNILPFTGSESNDLGQIQPTPNSRPIINQAIQSAIEAQSLSPADRLRRFSFARRFNGKFWQIPLAPDEAHRFQQNNPTKPIEPVQRKPITKTRKTPITSDRSQVESKTTALTQLSMDYSAEIDHDQSENHPPNSLAIANQKQREQDADQLNAARLVGSKIRAGLIRKKLNTNTTKKPKVSGAFKPPRPNSSTSTPTSQSQSQNQSQRSADRLRNTTPSLMKRAKQEPFHSNESLMNSFSQTTTTTTTIEEKPAVQSLLRIDSWSLSSSSSSSSQQQQQQQQQRDGSESSAFSTPRRQFGLRQVGGSPYSPAFSSVIRPSHITPDGTPSSSGLGWSQNR